MRMTPPHPQEVTLEVSVAGQIKVPLGPALERFYRPLTQRLTFENSQWKKKQERGHFTGDTPRYRYGYEKKDNHLHIVRGAWRLLQEYARNAGVRLIWDPQTVTAEEKPAEYKFEATLRPYQEAAVNAALRARGGVVVIPTGGGKTVVALGLAAALQTQTLFIVHTRELLRQTMKSAERFLGIKAGQIGGGKWKPEAFTVALIQTLARRDLTEIQKEFGLVIIDEAHHAPANTYNEVLTQLPARYRIALTATPFRKDGMHNLLWLQFGDIVYRIKKRDLEHYGRILTPTIHPITTNFFYDFQDDFTKMITALCEDHFRQRLVLDVIVQSHRKGGCSLVLTERIDHATSLFDAIEAAGMSVVILTGQVPPKAREEALERLENKKAEVLVATLSLIGEGWDYPPLETIYLTVPNGNRTKTTQAMGRILRPCEGKPQPRIFDFVDVNVGILRHHWSIRGKVYGLSPEDIEFTGGGASNTSRPGSKPPGSKPPASYPPPVQSPQPSRVDHNPKATQQMLRELSQGNLQKAQQLAEKNQKPPLQSNSEQSDSADKQYSSSSPHRRKSEPPHRTRGK